MILLITGCAGGLGKKLAEDAFAAGHSILITDINEKELKKFAAPWKKETDRVLVSKLDVTSPADWKKVIDLAYKKWGRLDVLLNVAGYLLPGYIYEVPATQIDRHMDINAKGVMYGTREAAIRMTEAKAGHIVNIASLAGVAPITGIALYSTSKFAVRGFSLAIAQELRAKNVFVTVVCPDAIKTPMLDLQKDYEQASMTFSGDKVLTAEEVSKIVLGKVLSRKPLEVLIPQSRGILAKIGNLFPASAAILGPMLRKKGLKKQSTYVKG
ncbi:SDR family oxidoreductase [Leptospira ellisii]|uniref:3-ketoacyl-ACP reductase n=1 Tax=Leptospira ellisii TaxID=2023197 RepID=A0A2N0BAV0_9LEPT|nr:SDR family oxidoreductase [Leptospira ellisii]MDV6237390.1 SDR family oxidoreductase [Leptospira ellisii]PJZ93646.1 3-ketoacyl-ACP reductase [Leptospira ellisii]PKA05003.1 3-ketoacyl-ACP reductase [Leptospira ellisii]